MSSANKSKSGPKWNSDEIIKFLELFQAYELLWNAKHQDYCNKNKRNLALMKLKKELDDEHIHVDTLEALRTKIKTIRNTYRQEYLKVETSKKSGAETEDLYEPKLIWYSTADSFLKDVVISRASSSNLTLQHRINPDEEPAIETLTGDEIQQNAVINHNETQDMNFSFEEHEIEDQQDEAADATGGAEVQNVTTLGTETRPKRCYSKIARVESSISKLKKICEARSKLTSQDTSKSVCDEYDVFAKHVATQLRQLPVISFVKLQQKFKTLITEERLNYLSTPLTSIPESRETPMISGIESDVEMLDDVSGVLNVKELSFSEY